jgi:cytochrome c oxidase cbb3-type subunit 2
MGRSSLLAAGLALAGGVALLAAAGEPPPADPSTSAPAAAPSPVPARPQAPTGGFTLADWPLTSDSAARGRVVYERNCIGCHGEEGLGNGPSAEFLDPIPRNFQAGNFKFRTTPSGELPTASDIAHVVRCGLQGSAMRSFPLMPQREIEDVAAYVLYLADFGVVKRDIEYELEGDAFATMDPEDYVEIRDEALLSAHEDGWPVTVTQETENDEDSVERGRALYEAQCVACHGASGVGDGSSSFHLRDWKDTVVRPRDFTSGIFRAGSTPQDLFLRMRTGLNGTPMPSVYGSDEDLWDLTHFIMSLQRKDTGRRPHPAGCDAHAASQATNGADG